MKAIQRAIKSVTISFCALVLAACGNNGGILTPKPPDLNKLFTMTANITQGEQSFTAQISRTDTAKWNITFSEPYQLQGVTFAYSREGVSAYYDGFSVNALTDDFTSSTAAAIIKALETAVQDQSCAVKYNENGFTLQSGDCILSFPQNSSKPDKFEISGISQGQILGEITDFQFSDDVFKNGADVVIVE